MRYFDAWCAQSGRTTRLSGSGSGGDSGNGSEPNDQTQCTVFLRGHSLQLRSTVEIQDTHKKCANSEQCFFIRKVRYKICAWNKF